MHKPTIGLIEVTIPAGQSQSEEIALGGRTLVGILMPAAWTAAAMTFLAGAVSGTLRKLVDKAGTELSITVAVDTYIYLPAVNSDLAGVRYLVLRSGTAATPVNQAAARVLQLVCRRVATET